MKKILLVLTAGITILSCKDADKTADANAASKDSLAALNTTANAANQPAASTTETPVDTANQTTIQWLDGTDKDFGKVKEGDNLDVVFRFKNTGSKPLVISNVVAGCGCTVPETPKKPYAPGESGEIKASFNSTGKPGANSKQVTVYSNTNPNVATLVFHVDVTPKKAKS